MVEQSFTKHAAQTLDRLEADIEKSAEEAGADLELSRQDNVIDIEFENGTKVVINSHQAAVHAAPIRTIRHISGVMGD